MQLTPGTWPWANCCGGGCCIHSLEVGSRVSTYEPLNLVGTEGAACANRRQAEYRPHTSSPAGDVQKWKHKKSKNSEFELGLSGHYESTGQYMPEVYL